MLKNHMALSEIESMKKSVRKAFDSVKSELGDHLQAINHNTSEVQSIYDYLAELDSKIEKLNERIDELHMYINPGDASEQFSVDLTHREQEVFVVLYAEQNKITAREVAKRLGFTDEMVNRYIYNLISKGIPVLKHFDSGEMYLYMDLKFKNLQAKKNVLKIDDSILKQLMSDSAI